MTWHLNEAADRAVHVVIANYAKAQLADPSGRFLGSLVSFCGMTAEEFARWGETGEVSGRWLRVGFDMYSLEFGDDDVVLRSKDTATVRVPRRADWRETMTAQARRTWPGGADHIQAYIETQVTR